MSTAKNEIAVFQAIWRKAFKTGEVVIEFKTASDAKRARFGLYNSVRAIRAGTAHDPELRQAVEDCSVRIEGSRLTVGSKLRSDIMQAAMSALGVSEAELMQQRAAPEGLDAEITQSQERLMAMLQPPPEQSFPYPAGEQVSPNRDRLDYASVRTRMKGDE